MILGLSVIIAFLSYLIYRRLCAEVATSTTGARGTRNNTFPAIPMWPFLSALLFQQPSPSTTVASAAAKWPSYSPEPFAPVDPAVSSPDSTPKASPAAPTIQVEDIPQISLSAPTLRINVIDEDEDDGDGDDYVPSFPSINSAQRASGGISSLISPTSNPASLSTLSSKSAALFMPPPPIPIRGRNPKGTIRYASIPHVSSSPPSSASVLRQNPNGAARSRLVAAGIGASGVAAGNGLTLPKSRGTVPSEISKNRRKVILEPGHSPLDWARLQRSGIDLRGLPHSNLIKVPPSLLAKHSKTPEDIWTALNGRVYNITAYLPFHPGGERDLLRGAGKDSTKLFNATHPWVNVEGMLAECLIGIFVSEEEAVVANNEPESALDLVD